MRIWLSHRPEVSLREQLVTQVTLGILCDELNPGQKLPSTRELARRFRVHPNTISAGYNQLEREGWLEFRRGSGVYVRRRTPRDSATTDAALDRMISDLIASARRLNIPLAHVRARLRHCIASQPPDRFVLIEPDEELGRIVAEEIRCEVNMPVQACGFKGGRLANAVAGAIALALPSKVEEVRKALPPGCDLIPLGVRSIPTSLAGYLPAPAGALVGVASRWPRFLKLARVMLVAAGLHPNQLIFRDVRKRHWQRGLAETAVVVCDCVTASALPKPARPVVFRVLSEISLKDLRDCERLLRPRP